MKSEGFFKFGVVIFPGSNCDHDCYYVIKHVLKERVEFIWHKDKDLNNYDCIILPGGFSYGDYLRAGAIAKFSPVMNEVIKYANKGGLVIGICNGFQILLESGLLPGAMIKNKSLKFICKHVYLKVENNDTPFTNSYKTNEVIKLPIAHAEGNYYVDRDTLKELVDNRQILFRYSDKDGEIDEESNPNGSVYNIAGICNKGRNIAGMMPHPERGAEAILGNEDGRRLFESIISWINLKN
jgi:phosphoribosylformylglycinamidine synthase